ncbi:MAG: uroporphyrinogen decarboxylase family protein [Phycisphaeraceae bacterium]
MNDRQRFLATMHYQPRDRAPICDFSFWPETIDAWKSQGLPAWVERGYHYQTEQKFFGTDTYNGGPAGNVGMSPGLETKVIEDRGDQEVVQNSDGVLLLQHKKGHGQSIPMYLDHTLKDRQSWEQHFKWRYDPTSRDRYPKDWDAARKIWSDPNCPYPRCVHGGSFYGRIRDMMGVEGVSYLVYDDPACFEDMVVTQTDCKVGVINRLYEEGAQVDCVSMWEDMCYNGGSLLTPDLFKKYLVPQIKRVTDIFRGHGCDIIWTDCDGKVDDLIPMWLEAGINCLFPIEVGTWGADPVKIRQQYGKELLMMGGFDKHILAKSKADIDQEIYRLAPVVEEGGFIPFPDHRVPPDVPLENYMHYLKTARL